MLKTVKNYAKEQSGSISVEFVILIPAIAIWIVSCFVFFDAMHKWTKSWKATYAISDLISRQRAIEVGYIDSLDGLFVALSKSRKPKETWLRVSSITKSNGDWEIDWSETSAKKTKPDLNLKAIVSKLPQIGDGESVLITETFTSFSTIYDWEILGNLRFNNFLVSIPRYSSKVLKVN